MKFGEAISSAFSNYANFKGRTRRSGYWFFYLFYVIVILAATVLDTLLFGVSASGFGPLYTVSLLALAIPTLAASVRRMHDVDKSGWFILVPIYNLILLLQDSQRGPNKFGEPVKTVFGETQNRNLAAGATVTTAAFLVQTEEEEDSSDE
jgi:uncharacterized membrane protein YhaH (DUF805 family)